MTVFAWIFFRANNIGHAIGYISEILSPSIFTIPKFAGMYNALITIIFVGVFVLVEWQGRENQFAIERFGLKWRKIYRWSFYFIIITTLFIFSGKEQQFIYFQF